MRRASFFIILFLGLVSLQAQNNKFVVPGKTWHYVEYRAYDIHVRGGQDGPCLDYVMYFKTDGDKVLGDRTYSTMYKRMGDGTETLYAYMREEDGKVYRYDTRRGQEFLLFDFTLEESDEISVATLMDDYTLVCKVTDVRQVDVGGRLLKAIHLKASIDDKTGAWPSEWFREDVWIEGVGVTSRDFLDNLDLFRDGGNSRFLTYVATEEKGDLCTFDLKVPLYARGTALESGEDFSHGFSDEEQGHDHMQYELIEGGMGDEDYDFLYVDTLHLQGYKWLTCSQLGHYLLYTVKSDGTIQMDYEAITPAETSAQPHMGAFLIDLKLPIYRTRDYYTIEDSEGTHTVGNVPDAINKPRPSDEQMSIIPTLHDLTGRSLTTPPAKGMWIEDGVKRVR